MLMLCNIHPSLLSLFNCYLSPKCVSSAIGMLRLLMPFISPSLMHEGGPFDLAAAIALCFPRCTSPSMKCIKDFHSMQEHGQ